MTIVKEPFEKIKPDEIDIIFEGEPIEPIKPIGKVTTIIPSADGYWEQTREVGCISQIYIANKGKEIPENVSILSEQIRKSGIDETQIEKLAIERVAIEEAALKEV